MRKNSGDTIIVYKPDNQAKWKAIIEKSAQYPDLESRISLHQQAIDDLNEQINSLDSEESYPKIESCLSAIEAALSLMIFSFLEICSKAPQEAEELNDAVMTMSACDTEISYEKKSKDIALKKASLQKNLSRYQTEIAELKCLQEANTHYEAACRFLDQPELSYQALKKQVLASIQRYEQENPAGQTQATRYSLYRLSTGIQQIEGAEQPYDELCHLLWLSLHRCTANDISTQKLRRVLITLLQQAHKEDNSVNFSSSLDIIYQSEARFREAEREHLKELCKEISSHTAPNPLYRRAEALVFSIENGTHPDDSKFYITFLQLVRYVLSGSEGHRNPNIRNIAEAAQECARLADLAPGSPRRSTKIMGAVLLFAGLALVVSSLAISYFSFGSLCFAGSAFFTTGTILVVTGASSLLAGAGLFAAGRRRGLSKAMAGFSESALLKPIMTSDTPDRIQPVF